MFNPKSKILIVDDMMTIRKIVKKTLTEIQFTNFVEASDGAEAWKLLQESPDFDLVISDWNMPRMSGIELIKMIRGQDDLKHLPFMFLTAESDVNQVKQALESGADNYILKPFTPKDLKEKLQMTYNKVKDRIKQGAA